MPAFEWVLSIVVRSRILFVAVDLVSGQRCPWERLVDLTRADLAPENRRQYPMPTIKLGCNCPMIQARSPAFIRCFYLLINVCLTVMLLPTLSFSLGLAVASASISTKLIPSSLKINLWTSLEWAMPRDLTM